MYKSLLAGLGLFALAACGSGVDQAPPGDGGGGDDTNNVPAQLKENLNSAVYDPAAQTLVLNMHALDAPQLDAAYQRNAALDIGHYQAYTLQDDPLDRHFTALVAQSGDPDQSVRAGVVSDGGQFNRYYHGGFYERTGGFTPPAELNGLVSYAGVYAGVTNMGSAGGDLLPVPIGVDPTRLPEQSTTTDGNIFLNVDFTNNVVNGNIIDRTLVDDGTALPNIVLIAAPIDDNGEFFGTAEYEDQTGNGVFGGIFGGTDASAVGGIVALDNIDGPGDTLGMVNEREHGVFVLIQCGLPGDAPICDNVN